MAKYTKAHQRLIDLINDRDLGTLLGGTLAEVAVELIDAKAEAAHWKNAFQVCKDELQVLAGVAIRQSKQKRLVITRKELQEMLPNTVLYVGRPEPGVRIYELRNKSETGTGDQVNEAVKSIIQMTH
jgi:hypothetical protein